MDFVLPESFDGSFEHMRVLSAASYPLSAAARRFLRISLEDEYRIARSLPYGGQLEADAGGSVTVNQHPSGIPFTPHRQAGWYGHQAGAIAKEHPFDLIHCHEWMTYYCGIAAKEVAADRGEDVPFVAHVHATEIDRGGRGGNPDILAIERTGLQAADRVVAVSHYTKEIVRKHYDVPAAKISVVHNGIPAHREPARFDLHTLKKHHKIVLFMGRITMSKGPEYFVKLAKEVTERDPSVRFIMVGNGDLEHRCIELAASLGLTGKILFNPFARGEEVDRAYQMADLFIMPSVSEPFGLVALEAMHNGTPAIVSKQSGVAEVTDNLVKVDFWDTGKMAKEVMRLLYSPQASTALAMGGRRDVAHLSWDKAAKQLQEIYHELVPGLLVPAPAVVPIQG